MEAATPTPLLTPYKMGKFNLAHRIVHAPVTRCRSYENMAQPHNALYYEQRAAPGVVLIAEACAVSSETAKQGLPPVPGLWSNEQVEAWKPVVDAVHAKGALFFCQIWHTGRGIPLPTEFGAPPRLEAEDIPQIVNDFRVAARNAIKAGFDGVEIHAANGFLVNQFWFFLDTQPQLQERSAKDTADEVINDGSRSLDTRCHSLAADVVAAVADEIGAHRVGVRLSPFGAWTYDPDREGHAMHLVHSMDKLGVLYCHVVEPRTTTRNDGEDGGGEDDDGKLAVWRRLLPLRKAFRGTFMVNGGYGREEGDRVVAGGYADLVSYGRLFLANPDLPERFRKKAGLNKYDRSTFYTSHPALGYTTIHFLARRHQWLSKNLLLLQIYR